MEAGKHYEKEKILVKVDMVKLLEDHGVSLKQNGKSYKGLCPFHEDSKPSLSVDRVKKLWNCFGCGEGGDSISFVQKLKQLDFQEALEYLAAYTSAAGPVAKAAERPARETVKAADILRHYERSLAGSREAAAYLESRGLTDKSLHIRFKLGYADGSLLNLVSSRQKAALTEPGYIRADGKEHFYGCIVFPIFEGNGRLVSMYGRRITAGAPAHLYLPGAHKSVFNRKASKVYDEIILTECIIDALSLVQAGMQNVQALYGTNGFTDEHLAILKNDRVKTVILALDNDEAGRKGSEKLKAQLLKEGFSVKQLFPRDAKDWNEYLVKKHSFAVLEEQTAKAEIFKPAAKGESFDVTNTGGIYIFRREDVTYRVLGVKDVWVSSLKVNIRVDIGDSLYPDNVDLYSARSRAVFAHNIYRIFGLEIKRIENDLVEILTYLEKERDRFLNSEAEARPELTEEEKKLGMDFLTNKQMFEQIIADTEILGYTGDELNKLLMYICASSRLMDDPISIIVISQSSAGKSYLIDTIRKLMPEEEVISMTSLSDQALNYLPEGGLLHKFLIMGEAVHGEIIEHQVREMLSAKELSRLVTTKDEKTGRLVSKNVKTKVVVASVMSSTNWDINNENASRVFLISSDESVEQTRKIHKAQREKYSLSRYYEKRDLIPEIVKKHKAAQRLLSSRVIVNPFARLLDFPDTLMRCRRDHERFIDLIACICFLRQFQKKEKAIKEVKENFSYIECDLGDYTVAFRILKGILPATLTNFPVSATGLYEEIREIVRKKAGEENLKTTEVAVTQREIREKSGHNQIFVKRYIRMLLEYEYLKTGNSAGKGIRNTYYLVSDEDIRLVDLSRIPTPEEMEKRVKNREREGAKEE